MTTYPDHWVRLDRDTPVPAPTPEQCEAESIGAPEPGTGTLWVHQSHPGVWYALWLSDAGFATHEGQEETVVAWAREQPAARVNLIGEVDSFFDHLDDSEPAPPPEPGTGSPRPKPRPRSPARSCASCTPSSPSDARGTPSSPPTAPPRGRRPRTPLRHNDTQPPRH